MKKFNNVDKTFILQIVGSIFTFIIILIFGNGLMWQINQAELEKSKLNFEKEKESINIRTKIDETLNEIIKLSNDIYKLEKSNKLTKMQLKIFKSRYDLLSENLRKYQESLEKISDYKIKNFNIPNPLSKYFDYKPPSPPKGLIISRSMNSTKRNLLFYKIQTNVITFLIIQILIIYLTIVLTRHFSIKAFKIFNNAN